MSPAKAATARRDGEGGGYCRTWTTAAWRKWRVRNLRTALLQVRRRQDERKRTPQVFSPSFQNKEREMGEKVGYDNPTCSVFVFPLFSLWGNPDREVR